MEHIIYKKNMICPLVSSPERLAAVIVCEPIYV